MKKSQSGTGNRVGWYGLSFVIGALFPGINTALLADIGERISYTIPYLDLAGDTTLQTIVDREPERYLGHVSTVMLEDEQTILATYPTGHGAGRIIVKQSDDLGQSWSKRLPLPRDWVAREVPVFFRLDFSPTPESHVKRLLLITGDPRVEGGFRTAWRDLAPDGSLDGSETWTPLTHWYRDTEIDGMRLNGRVAGSSLVRLRKRGADGTFLKDADGQWIMDDRWLMLFHQRPGVQWKTILTFNRKGNEQWSEPVQYISPTARDLAREHYLCEPGAMRSPHGDEMAILYRAQARKSHSWIVFSQDEGETFSAPRELPPSLTGDRHMAAYDPVSGRLVVTFRDHGLVPNTPDRGDWVLWVGTYTDLIENREGQYRVRLMDNAGKPFDCAYAGIEVVKTPGHPDFGRFVVTTYGHWEANAKPYIVSVRFTLAELDARLAAQTAVPQVP